MKAEIVELQIKYEGEEGIVNYKDVISSKCKSKLNEMEAGDWD